MEGHERSCIFNVLVGGIFSPKNQKGCWRKAAKTAQSSSASDRELWPRSIRSVFAGDSWSPVRLFDVPLDGPVLFAEELLRLAGSL
jgi:hypothetical protein